MAETGKGTSLAFSKVKSVTKAQMIEQKHEGGNAVSSATFSVTTSDRNEASSQGKKKVKRRYNPYRDPNFDPNSAKFTNYERKNSLYTKSEVQSYDTAMNSKSTSYS